MGMAAAQERDGGVSDSGVGSGDGERGQMGERVKRRNQEGYW